MFFSSKAFAPPVPHLSNKLKEVSETVSEEPDEYKREFIPLDDDGNVEIKLRKTGETVVVSKDKCIDNIMHLIKWQRMK